MLVLPKDRFAGECRRELVRLYTTLNQELLAACANEKQQQALRVELSACEEAIKRIDSGCFGQCKACGESIELNRLKAEPTTSCCLSCTNKN